MVKTVCVKRLKQYALRGSCDKRVKTVCIKRLKVCIKRLKGFTIKCTDIEKKA